MEMDSIQEALVIACGNPGAISVILSIIRYYQATINPFYAFQITNKMKMLKLYDYHIWEKYKECGKSIEKFIEYVENSN